MLPHVGQTSPFKECNTINKFNVCVKMEIYVCKYVFISYSYVVKWLDFLYT